VTISYHDVSNTITEYVSLNMNKQNGTLENIDKKFDFNWGSDLLKEVPQNVNNIKLKANFDRKVAIWGMKFKIVNGPSSSGFIEDIEQLSEDGDCWVYDDACVFDESRVTGNARIIGTSRVRDSRIMDDAIVDGDSELDNCTLSGNSTIQNSLCVDTTMRDRSYVNTSKGVYHGELSGHASVTGHATVKDTQMSGAASCSGFAVVRTSTLWGNAQVSGRAKVTLAEVCDDVL